MSAAAMKQRLLSCVPKPIVSECKTYCFGLQNSLFRKPLVFCMLRETAFCGHHAANIQFLVYV